MTKIFIVLLHSFFVGTRFAHPIVTIKNRIAKKKQTTGFCDLFHGGDDRDRTDYLLNAIQALSQVSYAPLYDRVVSTRLKISYILIQELSTMKFSEGKCLNISTWALSHMSMQAKQH